MQQMQHTKTNAPASRVLIGWDVKRGPISDRRSGQHKTKINGAMRTIELVDTHYFMTNFHIYLSVTSKTSRNDGCVQHAPQEAVFAHHGD